MQGSHAVDRFLSLFAGGQAFGFPVQTKGLGDVGEVPVGIQCGGYPPAAGCRSQSCTCQPRNCNCNATDRPTIPAPTTITDFVMEIASRPVYPCPATAYWGKGLLAITPEAVRSPSTAFLNVEDAEEADAATLQASAVALCSIFPLRQGFCRRVPSAEGHASTPPCHHSTNGMSFLVL